MPRGRICAVAKRKLLVWRAGRAIYEEIPRGRIKLLGKMISIFRRIFRRKKSVANPRLEVFRISAKNEGFSVDFSRKVARVIEYEDDRGHMVFTLDIGSKGNQSIAIDPPVTHKAGARTNLAIERTKRFLEACGFEVEMPS